MRPSQQSDGGVHGGRRHGSAFPERGDLGRETGQFRLVPRVVAAEDWAFDTLGWTNIIHCIAPDNYASQAVAKRLGSARLRPGRLPAPNDKDPIDIWGQSREEWFARRAAISRSST